MGQNTSVHGTPLGSILYGSVGAHGSTTDYWAAVGVTEQKAARSCLRLMSPCEESVHERAGIKKHKLAHITAETIDKHIKYVDSSFVVL